MSIKNGRGIADNASASRTSTPSAFLPWATFHWIIFTSFRCRRKRNHASTKYITRPPSPLAPTLFIPKTLIPQTLLHPKPLSRKHFYTQNPYPANTFIPKTLYPANTFKPKTLIPQTLFFTKNHDPANTNGLIVSRRRCKCRAEHVSTELQPSWCTRIGTTAHCHARCKMSAQRTYIPPMLTSVND